MAARARDGTDPARSFRGRRSLARANKAVQAVVGARQQATNESNAPAQYDEYDSRNTVRPHASRRRLHRQNRRTPLAPGDRDKTTDDTGPHRPASICPRSGIVAFPLPEPMTPPCDDERPTEHREFAGPRLLPTGNGKPARYQSRCIASRSAGTREPSLGLSVKAALASLGAPLPSLRSVAARP